MDAADIGRDRVQTRRQGIPAIRPFILALVACAFAALASRPSARADIVFDPIEYRMGLGLQMTPAGARVDRVDPSGAAQRSGIRRGDLILAVDDVYIRALTAAQLRAFATGPHRDGLAVILVRNGRNVYDVHVRPRDRFLEEEDKRR